MHADHRTNHAAQPVTQGIKFAANMWIRQFDFKTYAASMRMRNVLCRAPRATACRPGRL